jgi:hypothetical protein
MSERITQDTLSIEAIETQYPDDVNSRLWRDIKTHKYVQALKEFHGFLDQKKLMEPQWPDYNIIQNMLVRLYDTKRRVYADPNL